MEALGPGFGTGEHGENGVGRGRLYAVGDRDAVFTSGQRFNKHLKRKEESVAVLEYLLRVCVGARIVGG